MQIDSTQLTRFAEAIFEKLGTDEEKARETAEHLVLSNLKGHDSHGVGMIPNYVASVLRGGLKVNANAEVVTDKGAVLLVDGGYGFGQVVGRQATDLAIERAKSMGMACVGSRNNHHLGRIGTYAEHCVGEGLISIHFVNVVGHPPFVSLWGSRDKRVQTNPFCCGVPTSGDPVILDMATSAIALGKVRVAGLKGEDVPPGCLFDAEGRPTSDPSVIASGGSLGPFGGHKGSAFSIVIEILSGLLFSQNVSFKKSYHDGNNCFLILFKNQKFAQKNKTQEQINTFFKKIKSGRKIKGYNKKIYLPGEIEKENYKRSKKKGIKYNTKIIKELLKLAHKKYNLDYRF